jgi:hypothetical protein
MDIRRLLHPLPLFLVFLFVAVAVGDLVQKLTEEPPPPPELVGFAIPRFEALEPVIDFRPDLGDLPVEIRPVPELTQGQWSDPRRSGVWARGPAAEFMIDLAAGGHRVLILDCMPTSGKRSARAVHLAMNGIDCGGVALEPGWMKYRFALPAGATRAGPNRLAFSFPDPGEAKRKPRQLLVRRLGLFLEDDFDAVRCPSTSTPAESRSAAPGPSRYPSSSKIGPMPSRCGTGFHPVSAALMWRSRCRSRETPTPTTR